MKQWPDGFIDLCYLDPPFNSKTNYNILFGTQTGGRSSPSNNPQVLAFADTWQWDSTANVRLEELGRAAGHPARTPILALHSILGHSGMMAYLLYMADRLSEIKRVLKSTGSVYLHCDPTASHYLKLVMDGIFGQQQFRNEIVWCYSTAGRAKRFFAKKHDIILLYTKTNRAYWGEYRVPVSDAYLNSHYRQTDHEGRRCRIRVDAGKQRTYYPEEGMICNDWWDDIPTLNSVARERLGYPTQKPTELLMRIISASSEEGHLVMDPFCGCGTSVYAADTLGRNWIGIDVSPFAIDLIRNRRFHDRDIHVSGVPTDLQSATELAIENPFSFEKWAVTRVPGLVPNSKQVGDRGVDGRGYLLNQDNKLVLAQVKGGKYNASHLRDFLHTINRERAAMGIFITLTRVTSTQAQEEISDLGRVKLGASTYPKVQLWAIEDFFDDRHPSLPPLADPYTGRPINPSLFVSDS